MEFAVTRKKNSGSGAKKMGWIGAKGWEIGENYRLLEEPLLGEGT